MIRSLAGTLALLAFAAAPAAAQWTEAWTECSTGSMQTCASFQAQSIYDAAEDRTQLLFRVRNLHFVRTEDGESELGGSILAQFGVLSPDLTNPRDHSVTGDGADVVGDPGNYWSPDNSSERRLGDVSWALVAGDGNNSNSDGGILSCIDPDRTPGSPNLSEYFRTCNEGWVVFGITADGRVDMNEMELAWGVTSDSFEGESWQGTTEVVPEPITMVLFGSGLVGVGAAARRRRNGFDIETED